MMKDSCKDTFENEELDSTLILEEQKEKKTWLAHLSNKWEAKNILQVILILITFSVGGSICGILSKKIMALFPIDTGIIWIIIYILIATIIWPICVFVISFFFGQQGFFKKYLTKMGRRIFGHKN